MGIKDKQANNSLPGLLLPELGAVTDSQGRVLCGCLPARFYVQDHFVFLNLTFPVSYPPFRASVQLDLRCGEW